MTLAETIRVIEGAASRQPSVNTIVRNDVFRLNSLPNVKYGVFAWLQGQHTISDLQTFRFTFFYVDRLTHDKSNEIDIQSTGVQVIGNILATLEDLGVFPGDWTAQVFNQRFLDECAGVYASVEFQVPVAFVCAEAFDTNFEIDIL